MLFGKSLPNYGFYTFCSYFKWLFQIKFAHDLLKHRKCEKLERKVEILYRYTKYLLFWSYSLSIHHAIYSFTLKTSTVIGLVIFLCYANWIQLLTFSLNFYPRSLLTISNTLKAMNHNKKLRARHERGGWKVKLYWKYHILYDLILISNTWNWWKGWAFSLQFVKLLSYCCKTYFIETECIELNSFMLFSLKILSDSFPINKCVLKFCETPTKFNKWRS